MKRIILVSIIVGIICCKSVYANEFESNTYITLDDFDLKETQNVMQSEKYSIDIDELLQEISKGNVMAAVNIIIDNVRDKLENQFNDIKQVIITIIFTTVFAALIVNFSYSSSKNGVNEMAFYACYVLQISTLMYIFQIAMEIGEKLVLFILQLMGAIIPTYLLAVGITSQATALGFNSLIMTLIAVIEDVILNIVFPMLKVYMAISMVNSISKEDLLLGMADLIKKAINFIYKFILGTVTALNLIQSLILSTTDLAKNNIAKKIISNVPIVGNGTDAVAQIILSSVGIIKNSIGVLAIILIVFVCIVPMVKMTAYSAVVQISGAVLQPIADKRILNCIKQTSEGIKLLNRGISVVGFLFIITIAIICISTGNGG